MGIELRNGKAYRYHKIWRVGRCVSIYAGAVTTADRDADEMERAGKLARRDRALILVHGIDTAFAVLRVHSEAVEAVFKAAMTAAGYHLHRRSSWRRGRFMDIDSEALAILTEPGRFEGLMNRAHAGDRDAARDLRTVFQMTDPPEFLDTFADALGGDIPAKVEQCLLVLFGDGDLARAEAARFRFRQFRATILEAGDSPLERIMADRVALAWLTAYVFEARFCEAVTLAMPGDVATAAGLDQLQRRAAIAARQLESAVKTLALTRRLALPIARGEVGKPRLFLTG